MKNIKITGLSSVPGILLIALAFSVLLVATTTRGVTAQKLTSNASNAVGNMTAAANQTGTEATKNVSSSMGNASKPANQTMTSNNISKAGNTSLIGSAQQLSSTLGNNSEIIANNTSIGNSNMSL